MILNLESAYLRIQVDTHGGELRSICDREGTEYLWQGDARYWEGQAPNLFPYVGRLTKKKYRYRGKEYTMGIHGFVQDFELGIAGQRGNSLRLQLSSGRETRRMYPFDFRYGIAYVLEGRRLTVCYEVENTGGEQMYFGIGGHPGFRVPLEEGADFESYYLEFPGACCPLRVGFSADCFVNGQEEEFPLKEGRIPLRHSLFDQDAVVLKNMDDTVTLKSHRGRRYVKVAYPQMAYLGIWHAPHTEAPYVCIEPWSSLPSRKDVVEDLEKQENLMVLPAGASYKNVWSIECG